MAFLTQTHVPCRPARMRRFSLIRLMALYRQRRALASLSNEQLEDMGLTRAQALEESRRPLWDILANTGADC
jgi:uncharacterized protein YjiS (DUF1127 family)